MIKDRNGNVISADSEQEKLLSFLYGNAFGRLAVKLLCRRFISNLAACYMNSRFSKHRIKKLVNKHNIDINEYEKREYRSFNDFFTRRLAKGVRCMDMSPDALIAPADSKLLCFDISDDGVYRIKGCDYGIASLLGNDHELARRFSNGSCLVFRLTVDNYHRYCYIDGGRELESRFIPGILHTVNPIAVARCDVYGKNCRELTLLQTDNFGTVAYIEVGAMMVGRINNIHDGKPFQKGDEKGFFSFGGSTIVLLLEKGAAIPDGDIAGNSAQGIETSVRFGERIGKKP